MMTRSVDARPGGVVVEVGAGTGVVTQALLDAGVPANKLYVVELDDRLYHFLSERFPGVRVLRGDAALLHELLPAELVGKVTTVVSSLPLRAMTFEVQERITDAAFRVLRPGGVLVQYTYPPLSPLPADRLGLRAERLGRIWLNVPPAAVWRFRKRRIQAVA